MRALARPLTWQRIWNDPVWSKVISSLILASPFLIWPIVPSDPWLRVILAMVVVLGGALLAWAFFRQPIAWNFDGFLGMVGGGGELRIISFQATGTNRSGFGFLDVQGHLVSNIDNSVSDQLRLVAGGTAVAPSATTGIPPGATFQITIPLCDTTRGYDAYLLEHNFLRKWSSFRFVAELNGHRYERRFSQREVSRTIERFRRVANPPPIPEVRRKDPS